MKVANSYKNYTFDFNNAYTNDKGKLVVDARVKCDRCTKGVFISRIENGQLIPHPNARGVCFKCNGAGFIQKTIRVYTDEEFEKMEKANTKAAEKRESAKEERMKAEFADKRTKWLADNGFNADLLTYVYFPSDSYDKKEELKSCGFRFNQNLFWHIAEVPEEYADKCIAISLDNVAEIGAWGVGNFKSSARSFVESQIKKIRPTEISTSEWAGEEKERLSDIPVTLKSIRPMLTRFGFTQLVKFFDEKGNQFTWWTSVNIDAEPGDKIFLTGTVKKHEEYKGEKSTVLTRCRIKA